MARAEAQSPEAQSPEQAVAVETGDFAALLNQEFKPKSDRARDSVEGAVRTLAEQALAHTGLVTDDSLRSIEAIVAEIERQPTAIGRASCRERVCPYV